ncbi:nitrile hydratase [Actibacterium mucosum KCTC 23349]|uniref:Nitrile hydratase subunit beta n=1 Tax=Actibacterium mucosum KCTC 23349 TaxID=1454373 RepID=A0A037ZDF6_9RHOB|nr:nitrile hydratase subunit beta [Actibacterium mucosum]KAJ54177.1 nitrile hydratase [Actibacterium mucosum KCTC 23349]
MSRIHDMGGRFGDGKVEVDAPDAPVFAEDWHARALAVTLACGALGQWNLDTSRHAREKLSPRDYTRFSYYEKWMAGLADLLVAKGVLTREELTKGHADGPSQLAERCLVAENVPSALSKGGPVDRPSDVAAKFAPGDRVTTRARARNTLVDGGHTRLPTYAQGATGTILRLHGAHVFPDSNAHGLGEAPEPIYAVVFDAAELFGAPERVGDEVILDLWQSYLSPA